MSMELKIVLPDCMTFPCNDGCCKYGADVWPAERDILIVSGHATADDFEGPEEDEEGDLLYRTRIGSRGCVFLNAVRGCRLHLLGTKPEVCRLVPRDRDEAERMYLLDAMPCYPTYADFRQE